MFYCAHTRENNGLNNNQLYSTHRSEEAKKNKTHKELVSKNASIYGNGIRSGKHCRAPLQSFSNIDQYANNVASVHICQSNQLNVATRAPKCRSIRSVSEYHSQRERERVCRKRFYALTISSYT